MRDPGKISFERLVDWVEGRLSEEDTRAVEEQVAVAGEATLDQVEWLRAFVRVSEDVDIDSPPRKVRGELIRRFAAYTGDRQTPSLLQRLVATLSFDSGLQPAFGVRSAGAQEAAQRQLVYTTDAAEIALNIRPHPRSVHLDLDGQVFPTEDADPASFRVQLLSDTDKADLTTDQFGEFGFESVAPGAYQILVSSERVEILISPIELRR
jgi:hypothetical protein